MGQCTTPGGFRRNVSLVSFHRGPQTLYVFFPWQDDPSYKAAVPRLVGEQTERYFARLPASAKSPEYLRAPVAARGG